MLMYPEWDCPFEIHCDASHQAIAAILSQRVKGMERVVMYASRALTVIEKKYQIYEKECLAVVWAVEVFRKYIRNRTATSTSSTARGPSQRTWTP